MRQLANKSLPPRYRHKLNGNIPWGYRLDKSDPKLLIQIPEQIEALAEAFDYLKSCSYREVARWLSDYTGRPITHMGLYKLHREYLTENNIQQHKDTYVE